MNYDTGDSWDAYMMRHNGYDTDSIRELEGKGYPVCDFNCCLEKPGPDAPRCATVIHDPSDPPEEQCRGVATHTMFYSLRDRDTQTREYFHGPACLPCVRGFRRRPALQVTAYLIGQEPTPLLVPGNADSTQTDQSDSKKGSR
ncbi:hypothetical protein FE633_17550 [Streptomyces montanus]|uniref:Uncharacterized protein n=1 Tax=Streptomyces montanus TaxID=2580423 RepID=A0A5R9FM02_9ACTN|nr:hypothetical protein [Streptomyces montanus]TLS44947.1 hypothetical protein FE633_17550 [Streptomyces montanus]